MMTPLKTLWATALLATLSPWALALDLVPYSADRLAQAQQAGKPVAVHFHADWCSTCKAQASALEGLKADKALDLTVLVADYDKEKDLKRQLKVRSQSVMVVFKGTEEKARLNGDTAPDKIRNALRAAL
jgi:thiol-disulfide isomerase/thioredoxin